MDHLCSDFERRTSIDAQLTFELVMGVGYLENRPNFKFSKLTHRFLKTTLKNW